MAAVTVSTPARLHARLNAAHFRQIVDVAMAFADRDDGSFETWHILAAVRSLFDMRWSWCQENYRTELMVDRWLRQRWSWIEPFASGWRVIP